MRVVEVDPVVLAVPLQLNRWLGSVLWSIGMIGCFGNLLVFRNRTFRHRAYAIYLFSASICDFFYFNFG